MKLAFFLNNISYHQEGLCNAFYKELGSDFRAVVFSELPAVRAEMGFEDMNKKYPYIVRAYESDSPEEIIRKTVEWSDAGIVGSAPSYIFDLFLNQNKKVFLYSERFLKKGLWRRFIPSTRKQIKLRFRNNPNFEVLCASSYLPLDLRLCGYTGNCLQWGYFPDLPDFKYREKNNKKLSILWAARYIDWKHPEIPVLLAKRLSSAGYDFKLDMYGSVSGSIKEKTKKLVSKYKLEEFVSVHGSVTPNEIHKLMQDADIFLATSDYREGWGATVNESMASGCALVASNAIGSAGFTVKNGYNGLLYDWNDIDDLFGKVKSLFDNSELRHTLSKNAIEFMQNEYSPETAAKRFISYLHGETYVSGICSKCS